MTTKRIRFLTGASMRIAIKELMEWRVSPTEFKIIDDITITTKNPNVIDVITETFINRREFITITEQRAVKQLKEKEKS